MIWVLAIYCFTAQGENSPQYHRTFSSLEECEKFYANEITNSLSRYRNEIMFLPIAGPNYSDYVDEYGIGKCDYWIKFYNRVLPEAMTIKELREYYED